MSHRIDVTYSPKSFKEMDEIDAELIAKEAVEKAKDEARALAHLAIGRLLRIMSRSEQPGDVEEYYNCRAVIMGAAESLGIAPVDRQPNWCRERLHGDISQG